MITLAIAPPFTVPASASALSIGRGASGSVNVATQAGSGFSGAITLAAKLPAGVTAAFAPSAIAAPGSGVSKLTLSAASNATPGVYTIAITATSGLIVESASLSLTIPQPPSFTLSASPASLTLAPGGSGA